MAGADLRGRPINKWSKEEDAVLLESSKENGGVPDFNTAKEKLPSRTLKQAKERWEMSLNPEISNGLWNRQQQIRLLQCIANPDFYIGDVISWKNTTLEFPGRSRNSVKKKARTMLGEKVSKRCEKCSPITAKSWTDNERELLMLLHRAFKNDFEEIACTLRTGRACAQIERELLERCKCASCRQEAAQISRLGFGLKKGWTIRKAKALLAEILDEGDNRASEGFLSKAGKWIRRMTMASKDEQQKKSELDNVLGKRKVDWDTAEELLVKRRAIFESDDFKGTFRTIRDAANFGPNLARDVISRTLPTGLGLHLLASAVANTMVKGVSFLLTPSFAYMMASSSWKESIEKDPRFAKSFLIPEKKDRKFDASKPIGTTVRSLRSLKLLYTCPHLEECFGYNPMTMKPLETVYSKMQVYYLSTLSVPTLQAEGEVWVRMLEMKYDGTPCVVKQKYRLIGSGLILCRYQEVSEKFQHLIDLPPEFE